MKVKEIGLADGVKPNRKPRTIDGPSLQTYLKYAVSVLTTDSDGKISQDEIQVFAADIGRFDLILGRLWLHNVFL